MPKKAGMEAWKKKRRKDVTDRLLQINPSLAREAARCWTRTSRSGTSGAGWQQEKNIFTNTDKCGIITALCVSRPVSHRIYHRIYERGE